VWVYVDEIEISCWLGNF